jgi:hypothetical protein
MFRPLYIAIKFRTASNFIRPEIRRIYENNDLQK